MRCNLASAHGWYPQAALEIWGTILTCLEASCLFSQSESDLFSWICRRNILNESSSESYKCNRSLGRRFAILSISLVPLVLLKSNSWLCCIKIATCKLSKSIKPWRFPVSAMFDLNNFCRELLRLMSWVFVFASWVYSNIASKLAVLYCSFFECGCGTESSLMSSLSVSSTLDAWAFVRMMLNLVVDLGNYWTGLEVAII